MFRIEVVEDKKSRMLGDVFVAQPVALTVLTTIILAMIVLAAILLFTGSYARSERVSGYLLPSKGIVKISAANHGVVGDLLVAEGATVRPGQRLAIINLMQDSLDAQSPLAQSAQALQAQEAQLDAQIALEDRQSSAEALRLNAEQPELREALQSLQSRMALQRKITASSELTYQRTREIAEKGYAPKIEVEQRYQEWLGHQAQLNMLDQYLARARTLLRQNQLQLSQLPLTNNQKVARLRQERQAVTERVGDLAGRRTVSIISPIAGRVVAITGAREGGTLEPGQAFISIMPLDSVVRAELFVPSRAAGFLQTGQEVKLLYDAFPYQRFGAHRAVISAIGENILAPEDLATPFKLSEPVYRVIAELDAVTITARNRQISLQSGMTLKANIILERRSFLDWFLEPLRAVRARS